MSIQWPEGATHRDPEVNCFYKLVGDTWHQVFSDGTTCISSSLYNGETSVSELISRKQWSGPEDGLPPVGLPVKRVCSYGATKLIDSKVLAHSPCGKYGAYADECGMNWARAMAFRAIKTPAQQAAERREFAIRELMDIAQVDCRVTAARLVDAGFKREACK